MIFSNMKEVWKRYESRVSSPIDSSNADYLRSSLNELGFVLTHEGLKDEASKHQVWLHTQGFVVYLQTKDFVYGERKIDHLHDIRFKFAHQLPLENEEWMVTIKNENVEIKSYRDQHFYMDDLLFVSEIDCLVKGVDSKTSILNAQHFMRTLKEINELANPVPFQEMGFKVLCALTYNFLKTKVSDSVLEILKPVEVFEVDELNALIHKPVASESIVYGKKVFSERVRQLFVQAGVNFWDKRTRETLMEINDAFRSSKCLDDVKKAFKRDVGNISKMDLAAVYIFESETLKDKSYVIKEMLLPQNKKWLKELMKVELPWKNASVPVANHAFSELYTDIARMRAARLLFLEAAIDNKWSWRSNNSGFADAFWAFLMESQGATHIPLLKDEVVLLERLVEKLVDSSEFLLDDILSSPRTQLQEERNQMLKNIEGNLKGSDMEEVVRFNSNSIQEMLGFLKSSLPHLGPLLTRLEDLTVSHRLQNELALPGLKKTKGLLPDSRF